MLKADQKRFEDLASSDGSVSLKAAQQLQRLEYRHLYDHPVDKFRFSADQITALVRNWHGTSDRLLRLWIAQALALTESETPDAVAVLAGSLWLDGEYMPAVAHFMRRFQEALPGGNELIKSLHRHPNYEVRWRSAMGLSDMIIGGKFDYAVDMPILHRLMLDTSPIVRMEAVLAAKHVTELGVADYEILLDVVNIDSGAARAYAKELLVQLEETVPGCSPSAFAARLPILRTDGVYYARLAELDASGMWITSACLRFFTDGTVHYFGTNESPVHFHTRLPGSTPTASRGAVKKDGAQLSFTVSGPNGTVDYKGHIDGDELHLQSQHREAAWHADGVYAWIYIDWDAPPKEPAARPQKRTGKKKELPFVPLNPKSVTIHDVKKWYVQMLARIPRMLVDIHGDLEKIARGWEIKGEIREAAAHALGDPALKREFLARLPMPSLESLQAMGPTAALAALSSVTKADLRAFPGTLADFIGLEHWDGRDTWVMTESGWVLKAESA